MHRLNFGREEKQTFFSKKLSNFFLPFYACMTFVDARPYRRGDGDFSDEESEANLSFDLTDLPESPLSFEPETPPGTLQYTQGERCEFANDWSHAPQHAPPPPHHMLHASLASDDACTRALSFSRHCAPGGCSRQPLHVLCNEYASAKDLLNAFSSTTPPWTPEGTTPRFWGDTMPNMKLTASDYDFNYETNSLLPLTCSQMFETQVTTVIPQTRSANRASIEGGSSKPYVRSLTDDISKKLSDDLSSKLAQRRAWENDQQTDGNIKPCLINEGGKNYCSSPNSSQELKRKNNTILNSSASRTRMTSDTIANHSPSASRIIQHERTSAHVVSHSVTAHILEAKRLGGRRYSGLPDPSCWISLHCRSKVFRDADAGAGNSGGEVSLMDMKAQHTMQPHFKSPAVKQAQDPTWNSSVSLNKAYRSFSVMVDGFEHRSARSEALGGEPINLFLTVHDEGEMKNNFLGQAAILDICPSSVVDRWVTLQRRDGMPQIDSLGRVSSVRIKVEYSSSHAHMPPIQHHSPDDTLTTAAMRHGSVRKAQEGIRWNPYRQPSEEHHVSAQILQSSVRRMLANQTLRFKLLHARLLQSDADDDKTRRRKMEVSSSNYSLVRYGHASAAHSPIVARSSDYEIGSVARTPIVLRSSDYFEIGAVANGNGQDEIQKSGQGSIIHPNSSPQVQQLQMRESDCMMDQALRNRNSLGQVEALLNLGLGLLDKDDCKEQGHKYLNESWRLLENMKTADLHHDRAYSILQRMTQCGAFKDKPELITQLHNLAGLTLHLHSLICLPSFRRVSVLLNQSLVFVDVYIFIFIYLREHSYRVASNESPSPKSKGGLWSSIDYRFPTSSARKYPTSTTKAAEGARERFIIVECHQSTGVENWDAL